MDIPKFKNKDEEKTWLIEQIKKQTEVLRLAKAEYYKQPEHFYEFNRDILGWPDLYEPLHRRVCEFVVKHKDKKKLLLLPRGSYKSSVITVGYSLQQIARDPDNTKIFIGNATFPMATKFLGQIKDHLAKNPAFIELYGNLATNADGWREDSITISRTESFREKDPTIVAYGMGGNLTGSHFSLVLLDDVVSDMNIGTKDQIEKVIDFYKNMIPLLDPGGEVILIGTTWHQADLYSYIMDPENGLADEFAILRLPAYGDFVDDTFVGEWGEADLLFPTVLTWKELENRKKNMGPSKFSAQYLLNPVPSDIATFKYDFQYFEDGNKDLEGYTLNTFVLIDPAFSEEQEADYSTMVAVSMAADGSVYVRDIFREHVSPSDLLNEMFYWDKKWRPIAFGLEVTAFQRTLQHFAEAEMKKRNHYIPIKALTHAGARGETSNKYQRIVRLEPYYANRVIYHPKGHKHLANLEDELRRFPKGKNDDIIDALSSLTEVAYPPRRLEERHGGSQRRRNHYPA